MRLAAVVLLLAIWLIPAVAVRLALRRARRAHRNRELDEIDRVALRLTYPPVPPAPPTTYQRRSSP